MKDVAAACGVHPSTVSRALRNDPSLPEATRVRIQSQAQAMGYRPHPLVSALIAMRRSRTVPRFRATIAFIQVEGMPGRTPGLYESGARQAAERLGFHLETFVLGDSALRPPRLDTILRARNIPGVIIGPMPEAHCHFDLNWAHLCTVALEYTFEPAVFDRVVHDSYAGMQRALVECRRRGIRRVGVLFSRLAHERTDRKVTAAYWTSVEGDDLGTAVPPLMLTTWDSAAVDAWYEAHRPEAIVLSNVFLGATRRWMDARGLEPGANISLINLNTEAAGPVSGIFQNPEFIGATAARMVIDRINRNDRGPPEFSQTVLLPGVWVEGTTMLRGERNPDDVPLASSA